MELDWAVEIGAAQYQSLVHEEVDSNEDPRLKSQESILGQVN
jgi:hypothetical protein